MTATADLSDLSKHTCTHTKNSGEAVGFTDIEPKYSLVVAESQSFTSDALLV